MKSLAPIAAITIICVIPLIAYFSTNPPDPTEAVTNDQPTTEQKAKSLQTNTQFAQAIERRSRQRPTPVKNRDKMPEQSADYQNGPAMPTDYWANKDLTKQPRPVAELIAEAEANSISEEDLPYEDDSNDGDTGPMPAAKLTKEQLAKIKKHYRVRFQLSPNKQINLLGAAKHNGKLPSQNPIVGSMMYVVFKDGKPSYAGTFNDPTVAIAMEVPPGENPYIQLDSGITMVPIPSEAMDAGSYLELYQINPEIPHDHLLSASNVNWAIDRSTYFGELYVGHIL